MRGFCIPQTASRPACADPAATRSIQYCAARGVAHRTVGKLMIATSEPELAMLYELAGAASSHGVDDLVWLDPQEARAREPNLRCLAALHSPSTGIVDAHAPDAGLARRCRSGGRGDRLSEPGRKGV